MNLKKLILTPANILRPKRGSKPLPRDAEGHIIRPRDVQGNLIVRMETTAQKNQKICQIA